MTDKPNIDAMAKLIKRAINFADWAAGQGICPYEYGSKEALEGNPDEFLLDYGEATGEQDFESLGERVAAIVDGLRREKEELQKSLADIVEDLEMRSVNRVVNCSHGVYCTAKELSKEGTDHADK
jgi:hypothetical protein